MTEIFGLWRGRDVREEHAGGDFRLAAGRGAGDSGVSDGGSGAVDPGADGGRGGIRANANLILSEDSLYRNANRSSGSLYFLISSRGPSRPPKNDNESYPCFASRPEACRIFFRSVLLTSFVQE